MSKHPELEGVVRAMGVSYACAYMRLENGWDLARAVNTPVRVRKPKPPGRAVVRTLGISEAEAIYEARWKRAPSALTVLPSLTPDDLKRMYAWQRPGYKLAKPVVYKRVRPPKIIRKRHVHTAEDTSPTHIRKIRAAFCEEFIRTGEINTALQQQLKDYANECRASAPHSDRVPPGHEADCPSERRDNDGGRCISGHHDADVAAAGRIREFLRT